MPMRPAANNALKRSDIYMEGEQLDHISHTNSTGGLFITPCQF